MMLRKKHSPFPIRPRSRSGRRSRLFHVLGVVALLGLSSGVCYALIEHLREAPYLRIQRIRVAGTQTLDEPLIVTASGLTTSHNILFLDTALVAGRVEQLPYVKRCVVNRVFPDLVVIQVEERHPVATLVAYNKCFAIDKEGVVLEELSLTAPLHGPLITEIPGLDMVEVGQKIEVRPLQHALAVMEAFSKTALGKEVTVSEISARHENDIRMYCEELPFEVRWGRGHFATQARRLDLLWERMGGRLDLSEYCDLRFGRDIACK